MEILEFIKKTASAFSKAIESNKQIALFCHYDADGLSSVALFAKVLKALNKKFFIRVLNSLDESIVKEIKQESKNFSAAVFLDLASNADFSGFECDVFVIDHHIIRKQSQEESQEQEEQERQDWQDVQDWQDGQDVQVQEEEREGQPGAKQEQDWQEQESQEQRKRVHLINYRLFQDSEDYETSASILSYFFVSSLDFVHKSHSHKSLELKQLKPIALIGLIGDGLDRRLSKLSSFFLKKARESGAIDIKKGISIFSYSRPIHRAIEFSSIYIPGITGNSEAVVEFLRSLGIELKEGNKYRTFADLSKEEISRLITAIATLRAYENKGIDFIGNVYLARFFDTVEDAKEITTAINACGRLGKGYLPLAYLLGNKRAQELIEKTYAEYKFEIMKAFEYINEIQQNETNQENEINEKGEMNERNQIIKNRIIKGDNWIIIDGHDKIKDSIIGVICSMIANSGIYKDGSVIVGLADRHDGDEVKTKVSIRTVNSPKALALLNKVAQVVNISEMGGHEMAAGAWLDIRQKGAFLKCIEKILQEESVTIKI